jgi:hypothetical protein
LRSTVSLTAVFTLGLFLATPGFASTIIANNPGTLPATAEDLTNMFPTEIIGTLDGNNQNDVNMFEISIMQASDFSAFTVATGAFGIPDTVLSLFNVSGVGVYLNDDISASDTLSCLPSADAANPCPVGPGGNGPLTPGIYYLAISRGANYPVDAFGNEIFSPVLSTDVVGPSNTNPVAGWDGGAYTSPDFDLVNYDIVLSGTVPEPGTFLLTGLAGLALAAFRRARRQV